MYCLNSLHLITFKCMLFTTIQSYSPGTRLFQKSEVGTQTVSHYTVTSLALPTYKLQETYILLINVSKCLQGIILFYLTAA